MQNICKNIQEQIPELMTRTLSTEKAAELQHHINQCSNCSEYLRALQADDELLGEFAEAMQPTMARLESSAIAALDRAASGKPVRTISIWRTIMKSRITKLVAAAVIIIAVVVGIYEFGSSIESVAWGEVVDNVEQTQTFMFRGWTNMTGLPNVPKEKAFESEMVAYGSSEHGTRMETYMDGNVTMIMYMLPAEKVMISVIPAQKKYMRVLLTEELTAKMRQQGQDPRDMVRRFLSVEYTELGRATIEGIEVEGIEVNDPKVWAGMSESIVGRLWVDVKTDLPVRLEMEIAHEEIQQKSVMDQFQWDVELDADLFEPNIPPDYTLMGEVEMPDMKDEGKMVQGLRAFAEMTDGRYPSSMTMMAIMQEFGKVLKSMGIDPSREPSQEETQKMMDKMMVLQAPYIFYAQLLGGNKDPAYYGDAVTADDVDAVLMRWKISDDEYRVIFGDLTTENLTSERLAELENALEK